MLATAHTHALVGTDAQPVRVEVQSGRGTASFDVVGLPEATVRESRVRVKAALGELGIPLHSHALTVNLAPADVRKVGSAFDLAIALGTLAAIGAIPAEPLAGVLLLGELSLNGAVHAVRGVLPRLRGARALGIREAIVPQANGAEAAVVALAEGLDVYVARDLEGVVKHLRGEAILPRAQPGEDAEGALHVTDLVEVRGQEEGRAAIEVAAAGGHDLLFVGPPGAGKTMLARALPSILPPLPDDEALCVTTIHSIAGLLPEGRGLLRNRPFRAPHHSVSEMGLLGGGDPPRPGEISLAHDGVLFLDELPEFRRSALEGLRQPLEDGCILIARARCHAHFPARPMLVAAMNPCPCGWSGSRSNVRVCSCTPDRVRGYRARISGPILDRFDLHLDLPPVNVEQLTSNAAGEPSSAVRARVERARALQLERLHRGETSQALNARLKPSELTRVAQIDDCTRALLAAEMQQRGLTARAYMKILRVARTVADLDGSHGVRLQHLRRALDYRVLDRPPGAKAA